MADMTLEEALAAAEAEEVTEPVNDILYIDPENRTIILPESEQLFGVRQDKDVERKYFACPQIVGDDIDLSQHKIFINYVSSNEKGVYDTNEIPGSYWCNDLAADGGQVTFSWKLSANVTENAGYIAFAVYAKKADPDGNLMTKWHTTIAVGKVLDTLPDGDIFSEKYPDVITQIVEKLDDLENTKMDRNDPTGTGSFSMNRKADTQIGNKSSVFGFESEASGDYSFAEGYKAKASGNASHAENGLTEASGNYSHAEGGVTKASGNYSHAEGSSSKATNEAAHAEGYQTTASGYGSHSEGYNSEASGMGSHAENWSKAKGQMSHAEGNNTIAAGKNQHVQGKYNVEDTENKYAHIIGAGTSESDRKNIHTVDWDGNAVYEGTVETDGVILRSTTKGSTKKFILTIDDSGVLQITERK